MSKWLERLSNLGILQEVPTRRVATTAPASPVDDGPKDITTTETVRPPSPRTVRVTKRVVPYRGLELARDWVDLACVLDAAQTAYEAGDLSRTVVEDVAVQAAGKARRLPELLEERDAVMFEDFE